MLVPFEFVPYRAKTDGRYGLAFFRNLSSQKGSSMRNLLFDGSNLIIPPVFKQVRHQVQRIPYFVSKTKCASRKLA
jgi:hypothetical protein